MIKNIQNLPLSRRDLGLTAIGAMATTPLTKPAKALGQAELLRQFSAIEAVQAVAVSADHVYAIVNAAIGKYDKATGRKVASWSGNPQGSIRHLNSGIVLDNRLYCANSNFPETPMASSIEIFDLDDVSHIKSHSFGIGVGSATWIDRRDGNWFVMYAHYEGRGGAPGKDNAYTQLIEYDSEWRRLRGWTFPPEILARMAPQSCSGGVFGEDGLIYATAHHNKELYVLRFPDQGPVLETVGTIENCTEGQGVAWDPTADRVLWGISRERREVMAWKLPPQV